MLRAVCVRPPSQLANTFRIILSWSVLLHILYVFSMLWIVCFFVCFFFFFVFHFFLFCFCCCLLFLFIVYAAATAVIVSIWKLPCGVCVFFFIRMMIYNGFLLSYAVLWWPLSPYQIFLTCCISFRCTKS